MCNQVLNFLDLMLSNSSGEVSTKFANLHTRNPTWHFFFQSCAYGRHGADVAPHQKIGQIKRKIKGRLGLDYLLGKILRNLGAIFPCGN